MKKTSLLHILILLLLVISCGKKSSPVQRLTVNTVTANYNLPKPTGDFSFLANGFEYIMSS